eukprot:TRINITY_DN7803_c0_g1_i1.p2 TRINITY_DN7803_c0_g1~~TRINITY_DN7803_c0_g1_i1.p2  ORF type:complete len:198 (+),score=29.15 TRINITY_DN7803_c0_g1_i1:56-649(+)
MAAVELARSVMDGPEVVLQVTPPDTASNFLDFNVQAEDLCSDWLMQPVNEADYDSETQYCVDIKEQGEQASYYSHFTTKRKKKKRGVKKDPKPTVQQRPSLCVERLGVPAQPGGGVGLPKGLLSNAAVRRMACGAMPPRPPSPPDTDLRASVLPEYSHTDAALPSPQRRTFSSKPPLPAADAAVRHADPDRMAPAAQ